MEKLFVYYIPGQMHCPKCGFQVLIARAHYLQGHMTVYCPNGSCERVGCAIHVDMPKLESLR